MNGTKIIKLTKQWSDIPIWVNPCWIKAVDVYAGETVIDVDGWETWLYVKESPEEVVAKILEGGKTE